MKTGVKKTYFPWSMMVLAKITHKMETRCWRSEEE
jgi:hypothetical protein